jgi:hypothetical protein
MSRHLGLDLRLIIQDIRNILKNDIYKIAMQIHISLEYNSSKYITDRHKFLNRLLEIFQCRFQYRKINDLINFNQKFFCILFQVII